MDTILCDELIQEIFRRLPPPSSTAVSLVSRRWRRLMRSSTTSLSLHVSSYDKDLSTTCSSLSAFLVQHNFLSSLSIFSSTYGSDHRLLRVASSCCPKLRHVNFLGSPVSSFSLRNLAASCIGLSSLSVSVARPLCLSWLNCFKSLKSLSICVVNSHSLLEENGSVFSNRVELEEMKHAVDDDDRFDHDEVGLSLENLTLCGVVTGDVGIGYLWRNCRNVNRLRLENCESFGDYTSMPGFFQLLSGVRELELQTCRTMVGFLALRLAESCVSLTSILIHDGGCGEGLLRFMSQSRCGLKRLDLRLPLDLENSHLFAMSENSHFKGLMSLRLESCSLANGDGLKAIARAIDRSLEELALINCDIIGKEPGLLATLGQSLKGLRKLDLSSNKMLHDKEVMLMFISCNRLFELKLRGCGRLSDSFIYAMVRNCKELRNVDVTRCGEIGDVGIEFLVMKCLKLRRLEVEDSKLSQVSKMMASNKLIEIVS